MSELDGDDLNRRAFFAISHGYSRSVADDLIALLRSGAEIALEVREEIAAALDGGTASGVRLTVSGSRGGNHGKAAADAQRDALRVIARISAMLEADTNLSAAQAILQVSPALGIDKKKCEEAWYSLHPIYLECLAKLGQGNIGSNLDEASRESLAMSFAYGQQQQRRRNGRKSPRHD